MAKESKKTTEPENPAESETLRQQKDGASTLGAITQIATTALVYGAGSYFGLPFVLPAASLVGMAVNKGVEYLVTSDVASNKGKPSISTLAWVSAKASQFADHAISYLPTRTQKEPTTDKEKEDELKAQQASKRINWYLTAALLPACWATGLPVFPILTTAAAITYAANSITTGSQEALAKTKVGDWQRTAGAKTQLLEKHLQTHTGFHMLSSAVGIPILAQVVQGTSILGALTAWWKGCEIIDQAVTKGHSPTEARRIAEKISPYAQYGTSFKVGIVIACIAAATLFTVSTLGIGGVVMAPAFIVASALICGGIAGLCTKFVLGFRKLEHFSKQATPDSANRQQNTELPTQSRAQDVAAANPEAAQAFARTATAAEALRANNGETATEVGRSLRSAGATHHENHDGKERRHPPVRQKTPRHIDPPKRPL